MSQQWNPLQDLMVLQDRMNRLFEDATQRRTQAGTTASDEFERADWTPPSDIYETESGYLIAIDLPGIKREELQIDIDENRLIVKGTREVAESRQHRTERHCPDCWLPDPRRCTASCYGGYLYMYLRKR